MNDSEVRPGQVSLAAAAALPEDADWNGPTIRYDLLKEVVIAIVVVALLTVGLAAIFSSPDETPTTIHQWSTADPGDFLTTALAELNGTSDVASYGQPYNATAGAAQKIGPISLQQIPGVRIPVNTANDFVLAPLAQQAETSPGLQAALSQFKAAPSSQQATWETNFGKALGKGHQTGKGTFTVARADDGPLPTMFASLLAMADSGALDAALTSSPNFYGTDYTKPLLFLADGSFLANRADAQHLSGDQWGMMNETGSYPGQAWLWLYTMWYQVEPFSSSGNADALVWGVMAVLTLLLLLVPFIPGLRDIPRLVPVYRLIWRDHYRRLDRSRAGDPGSDP
ncbi:MAG TPA: hypothetical protein VNC61_02420 [Acidimicrobiales bacterium]|nr:hypothetical protein [Acidimicrobiales bacterium]